MKLSSRQIVSIAWALDTPICALVGQQLAKSKAEELFPGTELPSGMDADHRRKLMQFFDTVLTLSEKVIQRKDARRAQEEARKKSESSESETGKE